CPHGRGAGYWPARRHGIKGAALASHPRRRTAYPGCHAGAAAMTEPEPEPPATPPPETPEEPAPPPPQHEAVRRDRLAWLSGAGFLILAAALAWVWLNPYREPPAATPVDALAQPLARPEARMARLEQRPVAAPTPAVQAPDLGPLTARVAALEQRQVPN